MKYSTPIVVNHIKNNLNNYIFRISRAWSTNYYVLNEWGMGHLNTCVPFSKRHCNCKNVSKEDIKRK